MQRPKFRRESLETTAFYHMGMALPFESNDVQAEINYGVVDLRLLAEALDTVGNDTIYKSPGDLG